jgi:hypothetical protein
MRARTRTKRTRRGGAGRIGWNPAPDTAPIVQWIFAQRLAGHSLARLARALNETGIPCPSAADPRRNPHRIQAGMDPRRRTNHPRQSPLTPAGRYGTGNPPPTT